MNKIKPKLSVIILTHNEAPRIQAAISSVTKASREVIVIDQSSTDETIKLAKAAGAKVITAQEDDFAKLREIGRLEAVSDWIFYLDADEQMTLELSKEIEKIIGDQPNENDTVAYIVKRDNYYLGEKWIVGDRLERLFWAPALKCWKGRLHESPLVSGNIGELVNPLVHNTHRNLSEMVIKTNKWSDIEAALRKEANHPRVVVWRLIRVMISGFLGSYIKEGGWRMGTVGMIESIYQAFSMFITYAKLWELQREPNPTNLQIYKFTNK